MPTYEYVCENGHSFEEFQSMLAAPVDVCPICGGHAERQISGGTGLIFKGSGFYITDYARKSGGEAKSSKSNAKAKSTDSGSATTPTTPSSGNNE